MSWLANVIPARKASKNPNTSYSAQGLVGGQTNIQQPDTSGVEDGSSIPVRILELVPDLISPFQRTRVYHRMMNDAATDLSVRAIKTPVLGSEFFMEPYSADPNDVVVSKFIWDNLYSGMNAPLSNSLEDILHFFEDGYSVLDKVYEDRVWDPGIANANSRVYTMLKKLAVRPANTIKEVTYDDNGGPTGILQNAIRADGSVEEVTIDISKLLIFTWNRYGGDLTGKSILRTAYQHWYYKNHFYKIDGVQKERHSLGIPRGTLGPGHNKKDRILLRQMLRNIRSNHEAFIMQTPTITIDFARVEGNLVNVLESAVHHNGMILLNVMAQFLALVEHSGGGGKSASGSQVDMFMKSLRYVANYICDVVNMYLIPELVVWNFPTNRFPKLRVRNIGETRDLQNLASAYASLKSQDLISADDPLEEHLRRVFDMPAPDPTTRRASGTGQLLGPDGQPLPPSNNNQPTKGGNNPNRSQTGNNGVPPNAAQ